MIAERNATDERPLDVNVFEVTAALGARPARSGFRLPREGVLWLAAAIIMGTAGVVKGINLLILLAYLLIGLFRPQGLFGRF